MSINERERPDAEQAVERLAAFSDGNVGGNPAGVVICQELPPASAMQATAKDVGYSETVFAAPAGTGSESVSLNKASFQ